MDRVAIVAQPGGIDRESQWLPQDLISAFYHRLGEVDAGPSALEHDATMCPDG